MQKAKIYAEGNERISASFQPAYLLRVGPACSKVGGAHRRNRHASFMSMGRQASTNARQRDIGINLGAGNDAGRVGAATAGVWAAAAALLGRLPA